MNIKQSALKLVNKLGTNNPYEICDYLNILRVNKAMHPEIRGCYQHFQRNQIIYINSLLSYREQIIVCCHEIGHAKQHSKSNMIFLERNTLFKKDRFEIEADIFASEILIPDGSIKMYFGTGYTTSQIANELEVPESFIKYKIKNLGMVNFFDSKT